jgi:predicted transcriptional regulator
MTDRLNMRLPIEVRTTVDRIAGERGLTRTAVMRQALGLFQAAHDGAKQGHYIGLTKNPENLDTLLVAPL